jgi:hypothetical protein
MNPIRPLCFLTALTLSLVASACTLEKQGDVSEYREAIPQEGAVAVDGPETVQGEMSSRSGASGLLADTPAARADWAEWYAWTRNVRDGVNAITAGVLGSVHHIVSTEPTEVGDESATWGPYTDALEPATWRFRVTRVADHEYDYVLEGRPKTSSDDGDYRSVLSGKGYDRRHEKHGDGFFEVDLDAARDLDPLKHERDSGTIKVTHDLPVEISTQLDALPRVITAEVRPAGEQWFSVTSTANEDHTGIIDTDAFVDIDESKVTAPEDVDILSRWREDGAGRADITIAGGDLPAEIEMVEAVECWGTDFTRVYYEDSVNFAETEGDGSACAYDTP